METLAPNWSREYLYSDKIAIGEKKCCSLFIENSKPSIGMYFKKIVLKKIFNLIIFWQEPSI